MSNNILVFDLDGTIANTEHYHWMAYNEVLKPFDVHLANSDIKRYIGKNDQQIHNGICKDYNISYDMNKYVTMKIDKFIELAKKYDLQPFDNIKEIIDNSYEDKYILTSQNPKIVNFLLEKWNMKDKFVDIISLNNSDKTKLEILNSFKAQGKNITTYEDTPKIIRQFRDNGYNCFAVINEFNKDELKNDPQCILTD